MNYAMLAMRARPYVEAAVPPVPPDGWNLSIATFLESASVASQDGAMRGVSFKPDGTRMYAIGEQNDSIYEYAVSSPWDISTISYTRQFSVASQQGLPYGLAFKPDGTRVFVAGLESPTLCEYSMTTAWDISTLGSPQTYSGINAVHDLFFSPDGENLYAIGISDNSVVQFSLAPAWSLSGASYLGFYSLSSQTGDARGLALKEDGTKLFIASGNNNDDQQAHEYALSTPWDISTATHSLSLNLSSETQNPQGIAFSSDGLRMFIISNDANDSVYAYSLG